MRWWMALSGAAFAASAWRCGGIKKKTLRGGEERAAASEAGVDLNRTGRAGAARARGEMR